MDFKVGDIVEENGQSDYNHATQRNNWVGKIVEIDRAKEHTIKVITLKSNDGLVKSIWVKERYLKLSKGNMEEVKNYDKKILQDAEKEILEERAEAQKENAKSVLRVILAKQDKAKGIMEEADKELKEIDGSLKIFGKK